MKGKQGNNDNREVSKGTQRQKGVREHRDTHPDATVRNPQVGSNVAKRHRRPTDPGQCRSAKPLTKEQSAAIARALDPKTVEASTRFTGKSRCRSCESEMPRKAYVHQVGLCVSCLSREYDYPESET